MSFKQFHGLPFNLFPLQLWCILHTFGITIKVSHEDIHPTVIIIIKDITADVEVESKLKRSQELAQTLLNSTNEGFFMVDREMVIKVINKRAKEGMAVRMGVKVELGMNLLAIAPDEIRDQMKENLTRVFNGETIDIESKYNTAAGIQWMRISHAPVVESDGQITGAVVVTSDITTIKLNEEKVHTANQKISAMLSSTRDGFYMINADYTVGMINEAGKSIIQKVSGRCCEIGSNIFDFINQSYH